MDSLGPILACIPDYWVPGIGDPGLAGWLIVASYALAALAAFGMLGGVPGPRPRAERLFWLVCGLALAFLAVNKQLDLQSLLTAAGRCAARLQGWYETRRTVQLGVIAGLVALALAAGLAAALLLRGTLSRTGLALAGMGWVTAFVLVRAVGFHHVDRLIGLSLGGFRFNWALELGGLALFLLGVARARRRAAGPPARGQAAAAAASHEP